MVCKSKKDNRQRFSVPQHSRVDFTGGLLFIPKFKKGIKKPVSENKAIGIDFLQKTTSTLLGEYDTLCLETLSASNMVKNHCLARSINGVSWGSFNRILEYKALWQGKNILRLERFQPSSKICSCGAINVKLTLKDRVWTCHKCQAEHDRDILAARNILKYCFQKQYKIGQGLPESTLSEKATPSMI